MSSAGSKIKCFWHVGNGTVNPEKKIKVTKSLLEIITMKFVIMVFLSQKTKSLEFSDLNVFKLEK